MKKIFFILLSGLFTGPVFGETIKINKTPKVILYKLQIKTDDKKFKYYSEIIPLSLSKSIDKLKKYEIRSLPEVKDFKKIPLKSEQSKNYVNSLNELAKNNSADYIVTGTCTINKNALQIELQVYNSLGREYAYLSKKSAETGVILKETIDDLSGKVEKQISFFQDQNKKRFETSSVMTLYNSINFITFGIDMGKLYLLSAHRYNYDNSDFINSYLLFNFTEFFGVSLNAEYFALSNDDNSNEQTYNVWSGMINMHLNLRIGDVFSISLIPGGGFSRSEYVLHSSTPGPMNAPQSEEISTGGCVNVALTLNFDLNPLQVKIGSSYKRAFIPDATLEFYTLFFGIAYNI